MSLTNIEQSYEALGELLGQLQAELDKNPWTPVSEGLPDYDVEVWVSNGKIYATGKLHYGSWKVHDEHLKLKMLVFYWMPITPPQPLPDAPDSPD